MTAEPRRIWVAANTSWYVYNFRGNLISRLVEAGYEVTAYAPPDAYVSRIEALGARCVSLRLDASSVNPLRELATIARMLLALRAGKPDLVLTFTPKVNIYVCLVARLAGFSVIANISGLGRSFGSRVWLRWVTTTLYQLALRAPRVVFFQNEEDLAFFLNAGWVKPATSRRLPGSGVDLARFAPRPVHDTSGAFVFMLAARLIWDKGVGVFAEAARIVRREYPETVFCLLGGVNSANPAAVPAAQIALWETEGLIRHLGMTDDVPRFYAQADCIVLPSYYKEGVPRVLLEAASMAIPIITTDMPGCRDAIDNNVTGYLCAPKDSHDLAEKMLAMLRLSSEKREAMGRAGRQKMEREFDERLVITVYMEAIAAVFTP